MTANSKQQEDRGVASIFVVVAFAVVLIGVGFAIDVGQYVFAVRSVQNSADATVLALAVDCAESNSPVNDYSPYRKTGQTISEPVCGDGEATVSVTQDVGGLFLSTTAGDVERDATAKWGPVRSAKTLPVVVASCELPEGDFDTAGETTLYFDDTPSQFGCSSPSGGFSLLAGSGCAVEVSSEGYADGKPGNELNADEAECLVDGDGNLPYTVLIPVYDFDTCVDEECKGSGPYLIRGFAAFEVTGYSLRGRFKAGTLAGGCPDGIGATNCLRGRFTTKTLTDGTPCDPSVETCEDFGVSVVYLYS